MPKTIFGDFDEFAEALNGVAGRFVPTAQSETDWWVQFEPVGSVMIQQVQAGSAAAFVGEGKDSAITIGAPSSTPGHIRVDGRSLTDNSFILVNEGQPFALGTQLSTRWVGITIPTAHPYLPAVLSDPQAPVFRRGRETRAETDERFISMAKNLVLRLLSGESRVDRLEGAAIRAAEEELVMAASCVIEGVRGRDDIRAGRPSYSRGRVLSRALTLIESRQGKPLFLQDLCRATQVSERTLRNIFQEYFGVSPMRLLKVNRLREIRAALITSDLREDCVWKVAARFGIWDLSAFAREYKTLFGELPHQTLRVSIPVSAKRRDTPMNASWVRYAARKLMEASAPRRV